MERKADPAARDDIKRLGDLIKDVKIAMLTTVEPDGRLHSRPMATQQVEFDGELWFFTKDTAPKVEETQLNRHVSVTYSSPDKGRFVAVAGTGQLVRDRDQIRRLWNPLYKIWFPEGLDDPSLALLRIEVQQAEYWDSPSSTVVKLLGFVKALALGEPYSGGENRKLDLAPTPA